MIEWFKDALCLFILFGPVFTGFMIVYISYVDGYRAAPRKAYQREYMKKYLPEWRRRQKAKRDDGRD